MRVNLNSLVEVLGNGGKKEARNKKTRVELGTIGKGGRGKYTMIMDYLPLG